MPDIKADTALRRTLVMIALPGMTIRDEGYAKRPDDKQCVRLSRVLEYYEGLCWFPSAHLLYTGALSSENYQQSIALGYMPNDVGAGAQPAEF